MKHVEPNLPESPVTRVFASKLLDRFICDELLSLGVTPVFVNETPNVSSELRFHPDILLTNVKKGVWLTEKGGEQTFDFCKIIKSGETLAEKYPADCLFNAVICENTLLCGKNASKSLFSSPAFSEIILVKQAYAKCSVIILDKNSFITSDASIYKALQNAHKNVLKVTNAGVLLRGYSCGLIGGCAGKLDGNLLGFTGKIEAHVDYNKMRSFCENLGISLVSLSKAPLYDYGGLLPVTQACSG